MTQTNYERMDPTEDIAGPEVQAAAFGLRVPCDSTNILLQQAVEIAPGFNVIVNSPLTADDARTFITSLGEAIAVLEKVTSGDQ